MGASKPFKMSGDEDDLQGYEEPDLGTFEDSPFYPQDNCNDFDNIIVVDNLPAIPVAKKEKLLKVFVKHVKAAGRIDEHSTIGDHGVHMPFDADGNSMGDVFVEMINAAEAASAQQYLHGLTFDKKHEFKCYLWKTDTWCGVCSAKRSTQFKRLSSGSSCGDHDQSPSSPRKTKIPLSKTGRPGRPNSMPRISKLVNLLLMKRGRSASD